MNHLGTKPLETERLLLRPLRAEDASTMYENWASDPDVVRYLTWPTHANSDVTAQYIQSIVDHYSDPMTYDWGIELKEIGQLVGAIGVVNRNETAASMHIGYCIGKPWWNQGITSEAFARVIQYLMEEVGVNRIDSRHDSRNPHSGMVMQKCGLRYEGTLRQSDVNNQGLCDAAWYGLLREDYFANR